MQGRVPGTTASCRGVYLGECMLLGVLEILPQARTSCIYSYRSNLLASFVRCYMHCRSDGCKSSCIYTNVCAVVPTCCRTGYSVITKNYVASSDPVSLILSQITSWPILSMMSTLALLLIISGHLIWLFERDENPLQFPPNYLDGVDDGLWWSVATMTTVGYGDKSPKSFLGRLLGVIWMFLGVLLFGTVAGSMSSVTINQAPEEFVINGPGELKSLRICTARGAVQQFLLNNEVENYSGLVDSSSFRPENVGRGQWYMPSTTATSASELLEDCFQQLADSSGNYRDVSRGTLRRCGCLACCWMPASTCCLCGIGHADHLLFVPADLLCARPSHQLQGVPPLGVIYDRDALLEASLDTKNASVLRQISSGSTLGPILTSIQTAVAVSNDPAVRDDSGALIQMVDQALFELDVDKRVIYRLVRWAADKPF